MRQGDSVGQEQDGPYSGPDILLLLDVLDQVHSSPGDPYELAEREQVPDHLSHQSLISQPMTNPVMKQSRYMVIPPLRRAVSSSIHMNIAPEEDLLVGVCQQSCAPS